MDTPIGPFLSDVEFGTGSDYWEGIVKAYPSAPFTITSLFSVPINSGSFDQNGIAIVNTPTGQAIIVGFQGGVNQTFVRGIPNPTSSTATVLYSQTVGIQSSFVWIKYQDDGTNITCSFSFDGNFWPYSYTVSKASSYLGASGFNYLGLFIAPINRATGMTLMSWKLTNP